MRSEEEIREMLERYEKIKERSSIFTPEFSLCVGAIAALEYVLESEANDVNNN